MFSRAAHVGRNGSRLSRERTGTSGLSGIEERILLLGQRAVCPNDFGSGARDECFRNGGIRKIRSDLMQVVFVCSKQVVMYTFEIEVSEAEDANVLLVTGQALPTKRDTGVAGEVREKGA